MKKFISTFFVFFMLFMSHNSKAQELREVDPNSDFLCDSINNIVSAIVDTYCSVPNLASLENKCNAYSSHGAMCELYKEREAKYVINLSYAPFINHLENDQNKPAYQNNGLNSISALMAEPKERSDDDNEFNSLFLISCINSLSNNWHCTYLNYGMSNSKLSPDSEFRLSKLRAELLERSENLVSSF
ncbi:hypothetical protein ACU6U9_14490 [Pseudomonas sp. HK3]